MKTEPTEPELLRQLFGNLNPYSKPKKPMTDEQKAMEALRKVGEQYGKKL